MSKFNISMRYSNKSTYNDLKHLHLTAIVVLHINNNLIVKQQIMHVTSSAFNTDFCISVTYQCITEECSLVHLWRTTIKAIVSF